MNIVVLSDTHGQHRQLSLPKGDVLIHAGDLSRRGDLAEVGEFLHWYAGLDFRYKVFIAGNHDFLFERFSAQQIEELIPAGISYLNDSGITIEGINIWGSPITPWFYDWAFNRDRGVEIQRHWDLIPEKTDLLITHGPPYGILDQTIGYEKVGCEDLAEKVDQIQPKYHVFGHIHENYGIERQGNTTYVNASVLDDCYELVNPPVVLSI